MLRPLGPALHHLPRFLLRSLLRSLLGALALATSLVACTTAEKREAPVPLTHVLYTGPTFAAPGGDAVAIETDMQGTITAVHKAMPPRRAGMRHVYIPGKLAVPGLHDAHVHTEAIGQFAAQLDVTGVTSPEALGARVAAYAKAHPDAPAIVGFGWDHTLFANQAYPTAAALPDVRRADGTAVLVWLSRVDGHAGLANQALLARAGITKDSPTPAGGHIERDAAGVPTGVVVDTAAERVRARLPAPIAADRQAWLRAALGMAAKRGLVAVHDMGMTPATLDALLAVQNARPLPVHVYVYMKGTPAGLARLHAHAAPETRDIGRVHIQGVKLYADGALGSRGARLHADYSDRPGEKGQWVTEPAELEKRARIAADLGFAVAVHAIGDAANTHAAAMLAALPRVPEGPHRVEHAQVLRPADLAVLAQAGIVASMQPSHATDDMAWAEERLGPDRMSHAYHLAAVPKAGAPLALGSDAPIASLDVRHGLHAATARTKVDGPHTSSHAFAPAHALTITQALAGYAAGAAHAVGQSERGSFAVGQRFDATVFSTDARGDAPGAWLDTRVVATFVDGRLQHLVIADVGP